jgi:hypothetical protein
MLDNGLIVETGAYDLLLDKNGIFAGYINSIHASLQNKKDDPTINKLLNEKQKFPF